MAHLVERKALQRNSFCHLAPALPKHCLAYPTAEPVCRCRRIPILADTYVDREFGTGALKITPGHDPNDFEIGRRRGLPIINVMNNDGTFNAAAGKYAGMDRADVRRQLWEDLKVRQQIQGAR